LRNGPTPCAAWFEPVSSVAPRTLVVVDGQALPTPFTRVYSIANAGMVASLDPAHRSLDFSLASVNGVDEERLRVTLSAPPGQTLAVGSSFGALDGAQARAGLDVTVDNRSCTTFGRFDIRELVLAADGSVQRFAADVENHCGETDAAEFITIRFNSTVVDPQPFGGAFPVFRLTLTPPAHGTISGGGLTCGTGGSACVASVASPALVTLSATPDPGFLFAGWTGSCLGKDTSFSVRINTVAECSAAFESTAVSPTPRSMVFLDQ